MAVKKDNKCFEYWHKCCIGKSFSTVHPTQSYFSRIKIDPLKPSNTITGQSFNNLFHWEYPNYFSKDFFKRVQTFPDDYNFLNQEAGYVCGMSVPPFMMQRVSLQIYKQFFQSSI